MSRDPLVTLANRIGRTHPLYGLAVRTAAAHPADAPAIVLAAAEWARYTGSSGCEPLAISAEHIATLLSGCRAAASRTRRRGLGRLFDALLGDGTLAIDPSGRVRVFERTQMAARRLTPAERARVVDDAIRDLRLEARRRRAARDLLAIGLLGAGVERVADLEGLRRADLVDGVVRLLGHEIPMGDDVRVPALVLTALLESWIGPLRPGDALVPAVGPATLRAYRREDRPAMLPADPRILGVALRRRLRRAGLDVPNGARSWTAAGWFVGTGDGTFELPPDLALAFRC